MAHGKIIELETRLENGCPYYLGENIAEDLPRYLEPHKPDRCFLVTSDKLLHMSGNWLLGVLNKRGIPCDPVLIQEGEANKSWATLQGLCETLITNRITKDSILLAFGGGVIGNLVGLAASLIYRGIRFVEIPTTLMAQTDGTLSNKQAINGGMGKNLFGTYHAPLFIWVDAAYPRTEPDRQIKSGIVEGIKNGLITGPETLQQIVSRLRPGLRHMRENMLGLVLALVQSKLPILEKDPSEKNYAVILEYGHTFGHALEWLCRGALFHGEAVGIGMCLAAELSTDLGRMDRSFLEKHYYLLHTLLDTPTTLPEEIHPEALYETMVIDNKKNHKGLRFLLLHKCGEFVNPDGDFMLSVDRRVVIQLLQRLKKRAAPVMAGPDHFADGRPLDVAFE